MPFVAGLIGQLEHAVSHQTGGWLLSSVQGGEPSQRRGRGLECMGAMASGSHQKEMTMTTSLTECSGVRRKSYLALLCICVSALGPK
jgi:hypothetical protein